MKNWFLGVISGVILVFVLVFLLAVFAVKISSKPPRVSEATTLVLDLDSEIVEQNPMSLSARLLQHKLKPTLLEIVQNIDKAAADSRVTALLVRPRSPEFGWAKAEEIRNALLRFRASHKKLYCHLINANLRDYYVATACERIYMQPVGFLDVKGMRAEAMFWKGTLDKIGAEAELLQTGPYKTYADSFTKTGFTPEHREMLNWLVDSLYGNALKAVAAARGKTVDNVRAIVEGGPYEPPEAKAAGLVDDLLYDDQVFDLIKNQDPSKRLNKLSADRYLEVPAEDAGLHARQKIGVVYAAGAITAGEDSIDPLGGEPSIGSDSMGRLLRQVGDNSSLKAVILRVDSPGGDAIASDTIWREVTNLQQKKPVVISMSDVAASGGYYISSVNAPIVAGPNTITASIGVVYGKVIIHGLYDKLGITKEMVSRGPNALLDSDYIPYSPEQQQRVQKYTYDMYQEFLRKVAAARKMKTEDVNAMAEGRVFTGDQAKQKGLVDVLGGLDRAVELAKEKAGIARTEYVQLVPFPEPRSLLEVLLERGQSIGMRLFGINELKVPLGIRLLRDGRPLALMPFRLEFR